MVTGIVAVTGLQLIAQVPAATCQMLSNVLANTCWRTTGQIASNHAKLRVLAPMEGRTKISFKVLTPVKEAGPPLIQNPNAAREY